ncbi:diguanylate phosphodiesterase, partial [Pseudomonas putida]|nr:diguanylate phosphodiesterase [Pseudomonas putida]NVN67424.1 diguanylate phosphodiesterase [Pseudomonas putida]
MNPLLQRTERRLFDHCRSGFTREYGGGSNGERLVKIG